MQHGVVCVVRPGGYRLGGVDPQQQHTHMYMLHQRYTHIYMLHQRYTHAACIQHASAPCAEHELHIWAATWTGGGVAARVLHVCTRHGVQAVEAPLRPLGCASLSLSLRPLGCASLSLSRCGPWGAPLSLSRCGPWGALGCMCVSYIPLGVRCGPWGALGVRCGPWGAGGRGAKSGII
jgi:hypothetical protein